MPECAQTLFTASNICKVLLVTRCLRVGRLTERHLKGRNVQEKSRTVVDY